MSVQQEPALSSKPVFITKVEVVEWLPFPAHFRCLFKASNSDKIQYFAVNLDTLEQLERSSLAEMLVLIEKKINKE